MKWAIFIILAFLFTACDIDIEKEKLEKELLYLNKETIDLEQQFEKYQKEKERLSHSTAKERFVFLYPFTLERTIDLKYHEENFANIEWVKKGVDKYTASIKIQPKKQTFLCRFVVFVYDRKGLILGYHYEKPGLFGGKVGAGKTAQRKIELKLKEKDTVPEYFTIVYYDPVE